MKRREQRTIAGNKEKSQRRAPMKTGRLRSRSYVFGVALLVQLLTILALATSALAQNLLWAKRAGGTFDEICQLNFGKHRCSGIAVDSSGNSYVTGSFAGTATFGAGEPNETQLTSAGAYDVFVAKYNSDGTLAWAKQAGNTSGFGRDDGLGITVDGLGNSYITGHFLSPATFGAGEPNETQFPSSASGTGESMFVAKYNSDGTLAWAKHGITTHNFSGFGIGIDDSGNS